MSSGKNPLALMMALSVPGAAHALGLGDIHVDSALNERLAAEIDIVGATPLELTELKASLANRETFQRNGADHPAFLSSTTFKVTQDAEGRPVLAVRSTESFTDPVVNLFVDVTWRHGELIRQYTLLLDPAGFNPTPAPAEVAVAPPAATPIAATQTATAATQTPIAATPPQVDLPTPKLDSTSAERAPRKTTHLKVGAKATLRGIAWRVGERSESDLQRMMIAIFRANPNAFDGNINRLRRGALLTIPAHADLAVISKTEAKREIRAQMEAWRTPTRAAAVHGALPATTVDATPVAASPVPAAPAPAAPADAALDHRIESLEQELGLMKGVLKTEQDQLLALQQQALRAPVPAPVAAVPRQVQTPQVLRAPQVLHATQTPSAPQAQSTSGYSVLTRVLAGLGLLAVALAAIYFSFRRRIAELRYGRRERDVLAAGGAVADDAVDAALADADGVAHAQDLADTQVFADGQGLADTQELAEAQDHPSAPHRAQYLEQDHAAERAPDPAPARTPDSPLTDDEETQPALPILTGIKPAGFSEASGSPLPSEWLDATVNLQLDTLNLRLDSTHLDYNFLDLELTAQHVQMPSVLNQGAVVKERRTNLADALKLAIEREPDRHDLRMKLLELYFSAINTNRQAFLEVVQKFALDRDFLHSEQWEKIVRMGRQIASADPMFAEESADDDLAECA
jgi:pilus assembly protein FimV